ncbi:MAG: TRAP transporter small permease, partial [Acidobacteriota bacterium]|nr:TRAP transporter small permease [Acidobacteriota bacterium]
MMLLPLAEAAGRALFSRGVPGSGSFVQNLTLWVAFLGAALAAREGKLLSLATGELLPGGRLGTVARVFSAGVGAGASVLLARASLDLIVVEKQAGSVLALGVPVWFVLLALPVAFALIAVRLVWRAAKQWRGRFIAG